MSKIKDLINEINGIDVKDEEVKPTFNLNLWASMEYNDMLYIISKLVIEYRQSHNMTQKELAQFLNCKKKDIVNIESGLMDGTYDISLRTLVNLWNKLSTSDYNFGNELLTRMILRVNKNYEMLKDRRW